MYTWISNVSFAGETGFFISICPQNDKNPDDGCGVTFDGRFSFGPAPASSTISTTKHHVMRLYKLSLVLKHNVSNESRDSFCHGCRVTESQICIAKTHFTNRQIQSSTTWSPTTTSSQTITSSQTTTSSKSMDVTSSPSHKLSTGTVAAVSTVIPTVVVAAAIMGVYTLWRKRKAHPNEVTYAGEEYRKAELPSEARGDSCSYRGAIGIK